MTPQRIREEYNPTPLNLTPIGDAERFNFAVTNQPDQTSPNWDIELGSIARAYRNRGELSVFHMVDNDFRIFENMYFGYNALQGTLTDYVMKGGLNQATQGLALSMTPNLMGHTPDFGLVMDAVDPDFDAKAVFDLMPVAMQNILERHAVTYDSDFREITSLEAFDFTLSWHMYGIWATQTYAARAGWGDKTANFFGTLAYDPLTALEVAGGITATAVGTPVGGALWDVAIGGVLEGVRGYYQNDGSGTLARMTKNSKYMDDPTFGDVAWGSALGVVYGAVGYGFMAGIGKGFKYAGKKVTDAAEEALRDAALIHANAEAAEVGIKLIKLEDEFARTAHAVRPEEYFTRRRQLLEELVDTQDLTRKDLEMLVGGVADAKGVQVGPTRGAQHLENLIEKGKSLNTTYEAAKNELATAVISVTKKSDAAKAVGAEVARKGKTLKKMQRELQTAEKKIGKQVEPTDANKAKVAALKTQADNLAAEIKVMKAENIRLQKSLPIEEEVIPGLQVKRTANAAQVKAARNAVKDAEATVKGLEKRISEWVPSASDRPSKIAGLEDALDTANVELRSHQSTLRELGQPGPKGTLRRPETTGLKVLRESITTKEAELVALRKQHKLSKQHLTNFRSSKKLNPARNRITKFKQEMADLKATRGTAAERLAEIQGPMAKRDGIAKAMHRNSRSIGAVTDVLEQTPKAKIIVGSSDIGEQVAQIAAKGADMDIIRSGNIFGRSMEWIGEAVPFLKDKLLMVSTMSRHQGLAFRSGIALVNFRASLGGLANNLTQRGVLNHQQSFRTISAQMKRYGERANRALGAIKAHRATVSYAQYNKDLGSMWRHIMHETTPESATMRKAIQEIKSLMADLHAEGRALNWNFGDAHFPLASWNKSLIKENVDTYVKDLTTAFRETIGTKGGKPFLKENLKRLNDYGKELGEEWKLTSLDDLTPEQELVLMANLEDSARKSANKLLGFAESGGTPQPNKKLNRGFNKEVQQHAAMEKYYNKDVMKDLYDYMHDPLIYELASRAAIKDQMGLVFADGKGVLEQLDDHIYKWLENNALDVDRAAFKQAMDVIQSREAAQYRRRFTGHGTEQRATDSFANVMNNLVGAAKGAYWGLAAVNENAQAFMNHLGADLTRFPALMEMMFRGMTVKNLQHTPAMLERYIMHNRFLMEMGHDAGGLMMENSLTIAGHYRNSVLGLRGATNAGQGAVGGDRFWAVAEAATGGMRHLAIEGGFLRGITNMGKDFSIASNMDYMLRRTKKIRAYKADMDKAFPPGHQLGGKTALKIQRGIARKNGIDFEFAQRWGEKNLLSDEVFEPLMEILENKAFTTKGTFAKYLDLDKVSRWVHEPGTLRNAHRNARNELVEYLDFMADHEIATPNAWDGLSPEAENWLSKLVFSLTTFPRAFASRTVSRMATMPTGRAALTFGTLGTAELMYLYTRRLLAGERVEDINEEFSANPALFITSAFARTPLVGPWGYDIMGYGKYAQGEGRFNDPLTGAGTSQVTKIFKAAFDGYQKLTDWENHEIKDGTIELGTNLIPLANNWAVRGAIRFAEAMEGEDGPVRGSMDALRLNSRTAREASLKTTPERFEALQMDRMAAEYQTDFNTMIGLETVTIPEQFKDFADN